MCRCPFLNRTWAFLPRSSGTKGSALGSCHLRTSRPARPWFQSLSGSFELNIKESTQFFLQFSYTLLHILFKESSELFLLLGGVPCWRFFLFELLLLFWLLSLNIIFRLFDLLNFFKGIFLMGTFLKGTFLRGTFLLLLAIGGLAGYSFRLIKPLFLSFQMLDDGSLICCGNPW